MYHNKPDLINNMDHVRISDYEPSSVILSQQSSFKAVMQNKIHLQCRSHIAFHLLFQNSECYSAVFILCFLSHFHITKGFEFADSPWK